MSITTSQNERVLSGMRPTGALHIGHYHGVLKNWLELQNTYESFFFVADWHALTTHYNKTEMFEDSVFEMVVDWLACGINPGSATLFVQSQIPEHAELYLLLSMITPQNWLERVPSYKDRQAHHDEKDLVSYGFLGYPLLQSADILMYKSNWVPVGEDQVAHVELTREIARRFNYIYGYETDFVAKAEEAISKIGQKNAKIYYNLRKKFQEKGDTKAYEVASELVKSLQNISNMDREYLAGYLEGECRIILPEPQVLLTSAPKVLGLDGEKMSKSSNNTVSLRETDENINKKIKSMQTDPARKRRNDPGDPKKCPVWTLHQIYTDNSVQEWVKQGCTSAGIGCVDCKQPLIEALKREITPIRERALEYSNDRKTILKVIAEGNEEARDIAHDTLEEVTQAMGLAYR